MIIVSAAYPMSYHSGMQFVFVHQKRRFVFVFSVFSLFFFSLSQFFFSISFWANYFDRCIKVLGVLKVFVVAADSVHIDDKKKHVVSTHSVIITFSGVQTYKIFHVAASRFINIINWLSKIYLISVQSTLTTILPTLAAMLQRWMHRRNTLISIHSKQIICDYILNWPIFCFYNHLLIFLPEKKVTVDHLWGSQNCKFSWIFLHYYILENVCSSIWL